MLLLRLLPNPLNATQYCRLLMHFEIRRCDCCGRVHLAPSHPWNWFAVCPGFSISKPGTFPVLLVWGLRTSFSHHHIKAMGTQVISRIRCGPLTSLGSYQTILTPCPGLCFPLDSGLHILHLVYADLGPVVSTSSVSIMFAFSYHCSMLIKIKITELINEPASNSA